VVILDEADLLRSALFDELRILLNFEMDSADPLLLILAGQPQLLAKLALRVHLPFRQRVAMRYRMPTRDEAYTRGYLEHHLRLAGRRQRLFTDEAALQLFVQSGGVPRMIGNLALSAMFTAAVAAKDIVELDDVVGRQPGGVMNPTCEILATEHLREQLLAQLVATLSRFLACEIEDLVTDRADHAAGECACPVGQSAEAAQRIAWLCRQLQTQVERFERFNRMVHEAQVDRMRDQDHAKDHDDLPF